TGPAHRDTAHRQQLHRALQGHLARRRHRDLRFRVCREEIGGDRCCMEEVLPGGALVLDARLLDRMLCHVALQSLARATFGAGPPMTAPAISIQGVEKWYGEFQALRSVDLEVARGERIVVCGPSGSGKSTLIRCINRLEVHERGRILVEG